MGKRLTLAEKVLRQVTATHTTDEIEAAARALWDEVRHRRGQRDRLALLAFRPGDTVKLTGGKSSRRLPLGSVGKVIRLGKKNVTVEFGPYDSWRIPAGWLTKVDAKANGKAARGGKAAV